MKIEDAVQQARLRLSPPELKSSLWPALAAAALMAVSAVMMAGAVILGPGVQFSENATYRS